MNQKSDLNKYAKKKKKDTGVTKETFFIQNRAEKEGLFEEGHFLILCLSSYEKKIGTHFAYFDNTAKSKAKSNNSKY